MEAKFLVNPLLKSGKKSGKTKGVETIRTDLLMLTTISGLGLGRSPQAVDERLAGRLSEKMKMKSSKELWARTSLCIWAMTFPLAMLS